ncbi:hypothetical protein [Crenothrix sp.]|uniref:hypothetical protein n=1 Tax=Crenothrix sp. TaxID=3100433 RepID=UPI00374CC27E
MDDFGHYGQLNKVIFGEIIPAYQNFELGQNRGGLVQENEKPLAAVARLLSMEVS